MANDSIAVGIVIVATLLIKAEGCTSCCRRLVRRNKNDGARALANRLAFRDTTLVVCTFS